MEARLQELKASLRQNKSSRSERGGATWRSGRQGRLHTHAQSVLEDNSSRRMHARRMKVVPPTDEQDDTNGTHTHAHTHTLDKENQKRAAAAAAAAKAVGGAASAGGGFDEVASHNSFLEALNEWRSGE